MKLKVFFIKRNFVHFISPNWSQKVSVFIIHTVRCLVSLKSNYTRVIPFNVVKLLTPLLLAKIGKELSSQYPIFSIEIDNKNKMMIASIILCLLSFCRSISVVKLLILTLTKYENIRRGYTKRNRSQYFLMDGRIFFVGKTFIDFYLVSYNKHGFFFYVALKCLRSLCTII